MIDDEDFEHIQLPSHLFMFRVMMEDSEFEFEEAIIAGDMTVFYVNNIEATFDKNGKLVSLEMN